MRSALALVLLGCVLISSPTRADDAEDLKGQWSCAQEEKEGSPDLPGAKGPLFTKVGKLKGGVEPVSADIEGSNNDNESRTRVNLDQPPKSRTIPRGLKVLCLWVKFKGAPDLGEIKIEMQGPDGRVEFKEFGYGNASVYDMKTGFAVSTFMCAPRSGVLADGAYQAKVRSGDRDIAIINFQIGDPPK